MKMTAGIEIHVQLATKTKAFSPATIEFGGKPNSRACEIDIGMPGTLPVVNKEMMTQAIMLGTWLKSKVNQQITFARKHYFYPDLPKGYQITQDEHPILLGGELAFNIDGAEKICHIHHAHHPVTLSPSTIDASARSQPTEKTSKDAAYVDRDAAENV